MEIYIYLIVGAGVLVVLAVVFWIIICGRIDANKRRNQQSDDDQLPIVPNEVIAREQVPVPQNGQLTAAPAYVQLVNATPFAMNYPYMINYPTVPIGTLDLAGTTGPVGIIGPAGTTGPVGITGPAGTTGPVGIIGPAGTKV